MGTPLKVLVVALALSGCAGSSKYMLRSEERPGGPAPGQALVYFLRPSGFGYAVDFQVWDGDRCIGVALAKSCFAYSCPPGDRFFMATAENKSGCDAQLTAGKTYYVIARVKMGGWRGRVELIPVTKGSEYWDKAEVWAEDLRFTEPNAALLDEWTQNKRLEAEQIMEVFKTEEGREYVSTLPADAGR